MMKMRLIIWGIIFNCLIAQTYTQSLICNSLDGYDTKPLTRAGQWRVAADHGCLTHPAADCAYYIGFCRLGKIES